MPPTKQTLEDRYPGLEARLGTEPDKALAEEYGLSTARVWQYRTERGLAAFRRRKPAQPARPTWANLLFDQLRTEWKAARSGRQFRDLAELLGITDTRLADWASGTAGRVPPWPVLLQLAGLCGRQLVVDHQAGRLWVVRGRSLRPAKADDCYQPASWAD